MAQRVIILKRTEQKVRKVYAYLFDNWNEKIADEFYEKFEKTIHLIAIHPRIGRPSAKRPQVRRKLITKHNCVYYRIKKNAVIIINMLDTRQNPKNNPYE
jgi:plasmid stabilization system protein ParE